MCPNSLGGRRFKSFKLDSNSLYCFVLLSQSSQIFSPHLLQYLSLVGITIPNSKLLFQLNGNEPLTVLPSFIPKYFFESSNRFTSPKPLKVLCSSITPNSFIVKQYFIFGARNNPKKIPPFYSRS